MEPTPKSVSLRNLPSVEITVAEISKTSPLPATILTSIVRTEISRARERALGEETCPSPEEITRNITGEVRRVELSRLQPVINATGVMIHTNLGRSPLGQRTTDFLAKIAGQYSNLEFDLLTGKRGKRGSYVEVALAALCKAEAATVTNNCAAAVMLALRHLVSTEKNEVIISRGELVEIGGGFRVPEILECSGAKLREVGTTNKTRASDYARAIGSNTALILRVHRSNFFIGGFTDDPDDAELTAIAKSHHLPVIHDLGSGSIMATDKLAPIEHEPMVSELLAAGSDLVCFSGDKLLGGPQAGILAGRAKLVAGIKQDPLFRAMRCDKLILATLQETVTAYLESKSSQTLPDVPVVAMLATPLETLRARAQSVFQNVSPQLTDKGITCRVVQATSRTGGGTMPNSSLPSIALQLDFSKSTLSPATAIRRLRNASTPVVACIDSDKVEVNFRTVFAFQDASLTEALSSLGKS